MWGHFCRLATSSSSTVGRFFITTISSSSSSSLQVPTGIFYGLHRSLSHLSTKSSGLLSTNNNGRVDTDEVSNSCPASSVFGGICVVPQRGMKIKGRVKRRCKDCYLMYVDGILHNFCKTHPRHKQMLKPRYFANSRILTHATSHFKRSW